MDCGRDDCLEWFELRGWSWWIPRGQTFGKGSFNSTVKIIDVAPLSLRTFVLMFGNSPTRF
jgi:hypothetical protein